MLRTCILPPPASSSPSKPLPPQQTCLSFLSCPSPTALHSLVCFALGGIFLLISFSLPEPKDDVALEAAIYREFLKYGKCWVKIRRDSHHMPFAFVQFTSDKEALEALDQGKGAMIFGRPCRTEMVKANRTFVIQKKTGGLITIDEAEKALLPFGSLNKCETLHPQLREPLNMPPSVLVEFSMFDATRDLHQVSPPCVHACSCAGSFCLFFNLYPLLFILSTSAIAFSTPFGLALLPSFHPLIWPQAFRNHAVYTVVAFDLKKNCAATRQNGDEAFLAACERDRRSIFIGDLPATTTQKDLDTVFSNAGEILKINLIQRPVNVNTGSYSSAHSNAVRTMAFIEYAQPDMPEAAIAKFHGESFQGTTIRVERKSVKDRGPTPRHSRSQLMLNHKLSEESVGHGVASPRAPVSRVTASPAIVSTPNRSTGNARAFMASEMTSPTVTGMGPPMYGQWAYGAASPYGQNTYASYGASGGMPATPQMTPQMTSPWTYYNNYWGNMMAYDPSAYYGLAPYAFQSPTPMMGAGNDVDGLGGDRAAGEERHGHCTPTRGGAGQGNSGAKDGED